MIDIIIATYNRPAIICKLVDDILSHNPSALNQIIIVDSSDEINKELLNQSKIKYIHSEHKNQPYQRYLGYLLSDAEHLLYLDDDMLLLDDKVFDEIEKLYIDPEIAGINLLFTNKNDFINNVAKHSYKKVPYWMVNAMHWFTCNPKLPNGKFWYCGCRGKRVDGEYSEYFSGGAFCARRKALYKNFNLSICSLFEKKIGMGEDVILAYTLSKYGKIYNMPTAYFFHNDSGTSTYTASNRSYNYRVAYSRLYLSLEFARLNNKSKFRATLTTAWYHLWRTMGLSLICATKKNVSRDGLLGYLKGVTDSFSLIHNNMDNDYWNEEAQSNLKNGTH